MIVEDGTGKADAESYLSVADADSYHTARANSAWADVAEPTKEAALRYATDYLDGTYRWRGEIKEETQALGWPRDGAYDDEGRELTGLPRTLRHATAEIALAHTQEAINEPQGPRVTSESVEGAVSVTYADREGNQGASYPIVYTLIRGLVRGGTNAVRVRRA